MLEIERYYRRTANAISKEADGRAIVLKLPAMAYYGLDEVATIVWNGLALPSGVEDLARGVSFEFGVPAETAIGDLKPFLAKLLEEGLIESRVDLPEEGISPAHEPARTRPLVAGRRYAAPAFERGLLRKAAHTELGTNQDGGFNTPSSPQYGLS